MAAESPQSPTVPINLTNNPQAIQTFLSAYDTFLFDCDGVLWSGSQSFPHIPSVLRALRAQKKRLLFVTNNSTKSRAAYQKRLADLFAADAGPSSPARFTRPPSKSDIFTSSYSSALYISLVLRLPPDRKVFILGESGIEDELREAGISSLGGTDPAYSTNPSSSGPSSRPSDIDFPGLADGSALDASVSVVLSGLDFHPSYLKYAAAHSYLTRHRRKDGRVQQEEEVLFLATNSDATLPSSGAFFPGAGAMTAPLVTSTGRTPTELGKPSLAMLDAIAEGLRIGGGQDGAGDGQGDGEPRGALDKVRTCMVGDRLDTDIVFGNAGGLGGTLAVCSGVTTLEEIDSVVKNSGFKGEEDRRIPKYVIGGLGDMLAGLEGP